MPQSLDRLKETASQTAGPFVHIGLTPNACGIEGVYGDDLGVSLVNDETKGERIKVSGRIIDGAGAPLRDGLIEIWQADVSGFYKSSSETRGSADPNFSGWGRVAVNIETGIYHFDTIRPGRVPFRDGRMMAPHVTLWIVARGINIGLHTRMYFPDEDRANAEDPILTRIDPHSRVMTLLGVQEGLSSFRFDIYLQGPNETVFFDI
jgi:protocatechuate 3,4-dioxygenase alpha subunit